MQEYQAFITKINVLIDIFNAQFVNPLVPVLPAVLEPCAFYTPCNFEWALRTFPHSTKRGVYFLFAERMTSFQHSGFSYGAYVGKASLTPVMGVRFHKHLSKGKAEGGRYVFYDKKGTPFRIDWLVALPVPEEAGWLAPALEEYLLIHMPKKEHSTEIYLLNRNGNYI